MRRLISACVAMTMLTSACMTTPPGPLNGLGSDEMAMIILSSSDGVVTEQDYAIAQAAAVQAGAFVDVQLSGVIEAGLTSGGLYMASGAIGGASQILYQGATPETALAGAGVGAISGAVGGGVNGVMTASFANDAAVGSITEQTLRDWANGEGIPAHVLAQFPNLREEIQGLHATAAFIRSRNRMNAPAPGLIGRDWSGPQAGTRH